ncbi:MAG: acyl carrier protein [Actinobacteria bacterium]|nr:acyl carrier protein [Actinomycetota bacterium]
MEHTDTIPVAPGTIESRVRQFILETFWLGQGDEADLTDTSLLVDLGVVDSMNVLELVDFLEEEFDFMLESDELFRLTSIHDIAELMREKINE